MPARRTRILLAIAITAAALASCQPAVTPTVEATQAAEPTQPPVTPEPTEAPPIETPAPNMPAELVGSFRVRLPASQSLDIDAGWYRVSFREDGSYTIEWSTFVDQLGLVGVKGHVAVAGTQIVISDDEGFAACPAEQGVSGTYEWGITDDQLVLTPLQDSCEVRAYVLSSEPFPRVAP